MITPTFENFTLMQIPLYPVTSQFPIVDKNVTSCQCQIVIILFLQVLNFGIDIESANLDAFAENSSFSVELLHEVST